MWKTFTGIGISLVVIFGVLLALSPGKLEQYVDDSGNPLPNSLSEKVFVTINGVRQGMFIQSMDTSNPVLLYLHGGMPDYFLTNKYPTGLEDLFTVVWWEQRGSGISYSPDIPRETMTMDQLVADTLSVTNYLRERFGQEKIYIMGHSGGTFIGIQAAAEAPELYHAYLGEAQMSYQLASEKLAYDYMLEQFIENGNAQMVEKLEVNPVSMTGGTPAGYIKIRDQAMHSLGIGTMHEMDSVITGIFLPSLFIPEYTLMEKINLWRGKSQAGVSVVWDQMLITDLSSLVPELAIPVYFFHGIYDYTCSYSLAKDYFEKLQAPVKGFYTFEYSAHSPMFEEPSLFQRIMAEDVLEGVIYHADDK
ncbi:alpha/beta hydrolase [Chloroflexota bacterium]|nr:alpha/beta hydrolase [Chloroflexota bacterium]